ncbi:MAG: hypothetical protein WCO04_15265 [Pseudomonadota bacterium]
MQQVDRINPLKRISQFFYENSNLKVAILCTAIFGAYLVLVMTHQATGFDIPNSNVKSLGMMFGFRESDILEFFQSRTDKMIEAYINFNLIWDMIFALIYGVMYAVWLSVLLKASAGKVGILNLIPFLQVIFDWLENYSLGYLAQLYLINGTIVSSMAKISSYFVMIKWVFSGLTYFTMILAIMFLLARLFKKQ